MKTLVTGATGFIGKSLIKRLVQEGFQVVGAGRSLEKLADLPKNVKTVCLDVRDPKAVRDVFQDEKPEVVFHCSGLSGSHSLEALRAVNVLGTKNVLDACLEFNVKKVIYLSSVSVVAGSSQGGLTEDLPYAAVTRYGQSKIEAERSVLEYRNKGLAIAILRPVMVYGEEDTHAISLLIDMLRWRLFPLIGSGQTRYPLVYIENLIDVMVLCVSHKSACEGIYYVADKEAPSIKELLGYISEVWGWKTPVRLPGFLLPLCLALPILGRRFRMLLKDEICDIKRLANDLGYTPRRSFYDGMRKTVIAHKQRNMGRTKKSFLRSLVKNVSNR